MLAVFFAIGRFLDAFCGSWLCFCPMLTQVFKPMSTNTALTRIGTDSGAADLNGSAMPPTPWEIEKNRKKSKQLENKSKQIVSRSSPEPAEASRSRPALPGAA